MRKESSFTRCPCCRTSGTDSVAAKPPEWRCSTVARISGVRLWVLSQFSQCGVDPRKHPRSRPMRLNIRRPFSHGALLVRFNVSTLAIYINSRQVANHDRGRFMRWPRRPHQVSVEGQLLNCQELLTSSL